MTILIALLAIRANGSGWSLISPASITALVGLITAIGAVLSQMMSRRKLAAEVKKYRAEANKTGADAAKVLSDTAIELLDPYRKQVEFLRAEQEAENRRVQKRMGEMQEALAAAETRIRSLSSALAVSEENARTLSLSLEAAKSEIIELRAKVRNANT